MKVTDYNIIKIRFYSFLKVFKCKHYQKSIIKIVGPLGFLVLKLKKIIFLKKNKYLLLKSNKYSYSLLKTYKILFLLSFRGLINGFFKILEFEGVYLKFLIKKNYIILRLGFSHLLKLKINSNVFFKVLKKNTIYFYCINYNYLHSLLFKIRSLKKLNIYTNKGIRFKNEVQKLKEGKKQKFF
jgi:large subunit ribosomal protein L6